MTANCAATALRGLPLEVRGLGKRFGGLVAVKDMSFSITAGEILGLIGPNGSGKSTVMKLIMGIERPNTGAVLVDGVDVAGWPTHRIARQGLGIVFQHSRPLHRQTVLENIKLALLPDSLLRLAADPALHRAGPRDRRAGRAWRRAAPPARHLAVRRSAPHGTGQGDRPRPTGGADRRAVRRPDRRRGGSVRPADRRLPRRRPGGAAGRPQRQKRRRPGRPGVGHVSGRADRRGHRRRGDARPDGAPGLSRRRHRGRQPTA